MVLRPGVAGFYIVHHRWFDQDFGTHQLFKIGHTSDLGMRLTDGAYTTCFPPGWKFVTTFEVLTKEDAERLESYVLKAFTNFRVYNNELVQKPVDEIIAMALQGAESLGLNPIQCDGPEYTPGCRKRENLPREDNIVAPGDPNMDDLIAGMLALDWGEAQTDAPTDAPTEVPTEVPTEAPADAASAFDLGDIQTDVETRTYQTDATSAAMEMLLATGMASLQMACRSGKTLVSFMIMKDFIEAQPDASATLFLVPGLPLLRQTGYKLAGYGFTGPILLVGSDTTPLQLADGRVLRMTTDPEIIQEFLQEGGQRLVVSTYQSSQRVDLSAFALTIFDEAHRVCGSDDPKAFNHALLAPRVGARLFMTATPEFDAKKNAISMKDRTRFGGIAYRYHLREGIDAGYVNDFRVELVAAEIKETDDDTITPENLALPGQLLIAMSKVDKLLVFCRDIKHARYLQEAVRALQSDEVEPFSSLLAYSGMPGGTDAVLSEFKRSGTRSALFNCALYQEGVEIPELNGIFFASPRHSPRNIIQSICRPLNRLEGKPESVIFIPVLYDPTLDVNDPANLARFASIIPYADALLDEDPRLYNYLLDPRSATYPIEILGAHTLKLSSKRELLAAVRNATRYRKGKDHLMKVANIPWRVKLEVVRVFVEQTGRYPFKSNGGEKIPFNGSMLNVYSIVVGFGTQYLAWEAGKEISHEHWQMLELRTLPNWEPYNKYVALPIEIYMDELLEWRAQHDGAQPPMLITSNWSEGADRTLMERLSEVAGTVNMQDNKKGFKVGTSKNGVTYTWPEQLDRGFGPGWRKPRDEKGKIIGDSEFQKANQRFMAYKKQYGVDGPLIQKYFPNYKKTLENSARRARAKRAANLAAKLA